MNHFVKTQVHCISGSMPLVWFSLTPPKDDNGFVRHVCSLQNYVFTNSIFYDLYQFVWYRNQFYWSVVFLFCSLNFFLIASHLQLSISLLSRVISEISSLAVSYFSFLTMLGLMLPGPWDLLLFILLNCSENLLCWQFDFWVLFRLEPVKDGSGVETFLTSSEENIDANNSFSFLTIALLPGVSYLHLNHLSAHWLSKRLPVSEKFLISHFYAYRKLLFKIFFWLASLEFYVQQDEFNLSFIFLVWTEFPHSNG